MYCRFCGTLNQDDSLFCQKCGRQLSINISDENKDHTVIETKEDDKKNKTSNTIDNDNSQFAVVENEEHLKDYKKTIAIIGAISLLLGIPIFLYSSMSTSNSYSTRERTIVKTQVEKDFEEIAAAMKDKSYSKALDLANKAISDAQNDEEKNKAQKRAAEVLYTYNKVKPPVEIIQGIGSMNIIHNPEVALVFKNNSSKTIDAYKVRITGQDSFGHEIKRYGTDPYFNGIGQEQLIGPGEQTSSSYKWSLYGMENARKGTIQVTEVHFTDNTTWASDSINSEDPMSKALITSWSI